MKCVGISERECPKCGSVDFFINWNLDGRRYEKCGDCEYCEWGEEPTRWKKVGNKPFDGNNYIRDPLGDYHNHGKGYHKITQKHQKKKRVQITKPPKTEKGVVRLKLDNETMSTAIDMCVRRNEHINILLLRYIKEGLHNDKMKKK